MILSFRQEEYTVPWSSKCMVYKNMEVSDGDLVAVTSSVFSSINFISGAINNSEFFEVPIRLKNSNGTEKLIKGQLVTLNCDENDTFNMYVTL